MTQKLSRTRVRALCQGLINRWPNAHCELIFHTPFQLLVAVVLSAQTTDGAVNKSFGAFVTKNKDFGPEDLLKMGESSFLAIIRNIGLAPTKARNCLKLAADIVHRFQGSVPRQRHDLESLAGVGRKTANVVLNVLFGEPTIAVDTHVARVSVRMGIVSPTANRNQIEEELIEAIPKNQQQNIHHVLIFHGRYLCSARKPSCHECPVEAICLKVGMQKTPSQLATEIVSRREKQGENTHTNQVRGSKR